MGMKPHIRRNAYQPQEGIAFKPQDFVNVAENQEDIEDNDHYELFDDVHNYGPI